MKSAAPHIVRAGPHTECSADRPSADRHRERVEPWLAALCQADNLSLLVGSGLTTAVATLADADPISMDPVELQGLEHGAAVNSRAAATACGLRRGQPNLEDQLRAMGELIGGLAVLKNGSQGADTFADQHRVWHERREEALQGLLGQILAAERAIATAESAQVKHHVGGFLLPFASRSAARERLSIFTTNYDRLIEFGCDLLGIRTIDRFVGSLDPVFRATRLGIDMHYNPPGIRSEPRYLEGVVRLTKLHGSLDWRASNWQSPNHPKVWRCGLPFGAPKDHPAARSQQQSDLLVYPNAAKDIETLEYPYAELFRDFAAATCQPNSVVFTYGYGFGDDHVNRVLLDMLNIPSTHLAIMSYDGASGRIGKFCERAARAAQITLLIGPHFGHLPVLVENYLPKPAIDQTTWRMVDLLNRRRPRVEAMSAPVSGGDMPDEGTP